MINGEGGREESPGVASPDPFDARNSKADGDGASPQSQYSSCGESEFERYCSANSVMGTPSLCSSVNYTDCLESEFGSFSSSGVGDDGGLEGFSLGGRHERNFGESRQPESSVLGFCKGEVFKNEMKLSDSAIGVDMINSEAFESTTPHGLRSTTVSDNSRKGGSEAGRVGNASDHGFTSGLSSGHNLRIDRGERGREDEEGSSMCCRSEDEDLMYDSGSDNEQKKDLSYLRNAREIQNREAGDGDVNPLVMNSSVAFGSDDWDDFVEEAGEPSVGSLMLDMVNGQRHLSHKSGYNLSDVGQMAQEDVAGLLTASEELQGASQDVKGTLDQSLVLFSSMHSWDLEHVHMKDGALPTDGALAFNRSIGNVEGFSTAKIGAHGVCDSYQNNDRDIGIASNLVTVFDESEEYLNGCSISNVFEVDPDPIVERAHSEQEGGLGSMEFSQAKERSSTELISYSDGQYLEVKEPELFDEKPDPLSETKVDQAHEDPSSLTLETEDIFESKGFVHSEDLVQDQTSQAKTETVELHEFIDDVIHDMEEILLDSAESPRSKFPVLTQDKKTSAQQLTLPSRDGGSTASISGNDDFDTFKHKVMRIDGAEVIGARQKKGDVSISERLVGVKEYTVYRIKVWGGEDYWEVERRYRDFLTLYRRLKDIFTDQGWILPSCWSSIDKESSNFFGSASPDVVAERSVIIQECLCSILHSRYFFGCHKALTRFLSPLDSHPGSPESNRLLHQSSFDSRGTNAEIASPLGKTISLILEIRPDKSIKQMLEAQHYCCAGCHRHFDDSKNLLTDFVQSLGWGKPRRCEYTGQLYCSSCHTNEAAVLPARVLHNWDFAEYPVCQLAKSYLDSINDQPMLCVSAVNPFLFSKVPALLHVMGLRKKIGSMLPCVRCPFRRSINRGLGSRRYLLESNDFFALRDLIDLSKGAFAALPVMLETVSRKILEHITEQCLICCDVGLPCGARQACNDPSSLIFPFQEDEVAKCKSCEQLYHKQCFKKLGTCPCRSQLEVYESLESFKTGSDNASDEMNEALVLPRSRSGSVHTSGLLSGLFSKAKSDKLKDHRGGGGGGNVILMGSLPSTSL
ncbi:PX domain-containing protein [Psidium guajava]|nr:PX domain-containing protein [Psidium guajava]